MKSIKFILFIILLAPVYSTSVAQESSLDAFANKIKGRWYNTRNINWGGDPVYITPSASDSLVITRVPGTNNVLWRQYIKCKLVEDVTYLITWGTYYEDWVLKYNDEELYLEFDQNGFKAYVGPENTPYYTRIDTFTWHDYPVITSTRDTMHCGPGEVTLRAVSNVGAVNWYFDPDDEFPVDTGNILVTPVISNNTVYYARANDNGCMSQVFTPVTAKIKDCNGVDSIAGLLEGRKFVTLISGGLGGGDTPVIPAAGDSVIVSRNGIDNMAWVAYRNCDTLQSGLYEIVFDTMLTRSGKSWMLVNEIDPSMIIEYATRDYLYLAMDVMDGYRFRMDRIDTFTLHKFPSVAGITDGSRCGTGEVRLEAIADPGIIQWYADPAGDEVIATGDTFITPFLATTTVYYVESVEAGCKTARIAVTAVISLHDSCFVHTSNPAMTGILKIYPNPAREYLEINAEFVNEMVSIYNSAGEVLINTKVTGHPLDVSSLESGIYFLKARNSIFKFVKE